MDLKGQSILTARHSSVDKINDKFVTKLPKDIPITYTSINNVSDQEGAVQYPQ